MKLNRTPSIHDRKWRNEENYNWNILESAFSKIDGSGLIEVSHNILITEGLTEGILSSGNVTPNSLFWTTPHIMLPANTPFIIESGSAVSASVYRGDGRYISGYASVVEYPQVSPAGTVTIRVSFRKDEINTTQLYIGTQRKEYAPPGVKYSDKIYDTDFINEIKTLVDSLGSGGLEAYDKSLNKADTYINFATGNEATSTSWSATTNIPLLPGTLYLKTLRGQTAYYNKKNEYVGGSGNEVTDMLFTTPPDATSGRFSIPKGKEDEFKITRLNNDNVSSVKGIFKELLNPFKQSYVKMIGDSNVMGSGGTGYTYSDSTNELVPGYSDRYFNENGYCWANELRDYLVEKFNGEQIVGLNHDEIKPLKRIPVTTYDGNAISSYNTNVNSNSPIEFEFYGDSLSLFTTQSTGSVEIKINGNVSKSISAFNSVNEEHVFTGLTLKTHKVEINVTSGTVSFTGIKLKKRTIAKNYGVTGVGTDYVIRRINSLLDGKETIVMCLAGSNDRIPNANADYLSELVENYKMIYLSIVNSGAKPVLLSSTPASVENETSLTRDFDKGDVDTATSIASAFFGYEHISVYNYILEYSELTGTPIDSLLADGVHPNDEGYRLAFNYICKEIGIGRKRPDATW